MAWKAWVANARCATSQVSHLGSCVHCLASSYMVAVHVARIALSPRWLHWASASFYAIGKCQELLLTHKTSSFLRALYGQPCLLAVQPLPAAIPLPSPRDCPLLLLRDAAQWRTGGHMHTPVPGDRTISYEPGLQAGSLELLPIHLHAAYVHPMGLSLL